MSTSGIEHAEAVLVVGRLRLLDGSCAPSMSVHFRRVTRSTKGESERSPSGNGQDQASFLDDRGHEARQGEHPQELVAARVDDARGKEVDAGPKWKCPSRTRPKGPQHTERDGGGDAST